MVAGQPWSETEDVLLYRQLVASTLASRATFYSNPDLAPWSNNGGDRINKKIQQLLRKVGAGIPGAKKVVNEELAKIGRGGGGKGKTPTPTKKGGKINQTSSSTPINKGGKKRKVESEEEEEEEEEVKEE